MTDQEFIPSHPRVPARLTYEQARDLAAEDDPKIRKALAEHPATPPEILYFLAKDTDIDIRRAVACNPNTPRQADLLLTSDESPEVRHDLVNKINRITPDLTEDKRKAVYEVTVQMLELLAVDQVVRVRQILADAIKDLPEVPKSLVHQLATDAELIVAEPVLQFSPVFNDADLADIIHQKPVQGAISAISRRAQLSADLSEAIVDSGDRDAIGHLLENPRAEINEGTMNTILDQAPCVPAWHGPLVSRPKLSSNAAQRLASFVAMNLLDQLQQRNDLDDDTLVALTMAVEKRLADEAKAAREEEKQKTWEEEEAEREAAEEEDEAENGAEDEWSTDDEEFQHVQTLHQVGGLDADAIDEAFDEDRKKFVIAAVAILADLPYGLIGKTFGRPQAREITAICWKAGLSPHFARRVQMQYARIDQKGLVSPKPDGSYSLTEPAMKKILFGLQG
ncbi:DUF2336 domain-containing protein [Aestuariispira insulae]|uniref:Uncharacterized protein DUF2336 n=1 Tax=Aestuariispira insulae TaxID=1461337 RepID=A0A3D9H6F5_9PROT|nr:DUF2336 domain-containing protein [Aestuariispira insulae]RED45029.1 uncharacterized protein DUF2336 [Aestuariispira insulae]